LAFELIVDLSPVEARLSGLGQEPVKAAIRRGIRRGGRIRTCD
jgi:hypothetical protein